MDRRRLLLLAGSAALAPGLSLAAEPARPRPPMPPRRDLWIEQLGRRRNDPYAWLRDSNWAEVSRDTSLMQPEIRTHLEAENRYAEALLAPVRPRQAAYAERMLALAAGDDAEPPVPDGPWAYYTYVRPGEDHTVHARRPVAGGPEEILLDEQARAAGHDYFRTEGAAHSPDHSLFVWAEDISGGDRYRVCVRDLTTGDIRTTGEAEAYGWEGLTVSPCSQWVFWIWRDPLGRPAKVYRRPARGETDELVYEERDPALFMSLMRMASNAYAAIHIQGPDVDEFRLIPAQTPTAEPILVEPRQPGLHYQVQEWNGRLVILTDADGAVDGKIMTAPPQTPGRAHWQDWIAHQPGRHILALRPLRDHLVRLQRQDGRLEVVALDRKGAQTQVAFDEPAYAVALEPQQEYDTAVLRLTYQSPRTPTQWLACDLATGAREVVKQRRIGGGYSAEAFEVRRLFAPATDGEQVPITVLMKTGAKLDGSSPLLLYAYGAYGVSSEAEFSIPAIALVEQGFVYAIAHVRGGSEKGRRWFLEGRKFQKANTFTDYIACAEHLIEAGYSAKERIVGYGLSAGGLLMGAVANMRPDLWGGIIAQVPFVDMLNTMSDADHPLVPAFRPDWGDPLADPQAYDYIAAISPYENVKAQVYPPILATAGVRDPRVSYWEPAKWVSEIRHRMTGGGPILFLTDMAAGHQASGGLSSQFAQMGLFWAFAEQSLEWSA